MSRWATISTSLSLLILSAVAASAADDVPRNIELKPGAAAAADQTAADTSTTEDKTRQIVTEGKAAAPAVAAPDGAALAPADAAGKPDTPKEGEGASTAAPAPAIAAPADKAAAVAAAPPGPPPVALGPGELVIAVQTELKRVGCYPGEIDGAWGGQSREALAAFGHFAKVDVAELAPTAEILAVIKGKGAAVCVAGGEAQPSVDEASPPPEPTPSHQDGGGGYYGGGGY